MHTLDFSSNTKYVSKKKGKKQLQRHKKVLLREAYRPPCSKLLGGPLVPHSPSWPDPGEGLPTLDRRRGTYLGVPLTWLGEGVPTLNRGEGYPPWPGYPLAPVWTDRHLWKQYLLVVLRTRAVINVKYVSDIFANSSFGRDNGQNCQQTIIFLVFNDFFLKGANSQFWMACTIDLNWPEINFAIKKSVVIHQPVKWVKSWKTCYAQLFNVFTFRCIIVQITSSLSG